MVLVSDTHYRCKNRRKLPFSRRQTTSVCSDDRNDKGVRMCVFSFAWMTLTLTPLPWYSTLTNILRSCICIPKMKFVGQGVQKLEPRQDRQTDTQTDWTENTSTPRTRMVIIRSNDFLSEHFWVASAWNPFLMLVPRAGEGVRSQLRTCSTESKWYKPASIIGLALR